MEVTVQVSDNNQSKLSNSTEQASIHTRLIQKHDIKNRQQILLYNPETRLSGAFTAAYSHSNQDADVILSEKGMTPLADTEQFTGKFSTTVPRNDLTYQEAWRTNQSVETTWHQDSDQVEPSVEWRMLA